MYKLAEKLYKIPRSITGDGVRKTLSILKDICPELNIFEVASDTQVFDWTIPKEWNIKDAWIKNSKGEKIIDFNENNLHVVSYSTPIHKKISLSELKEIVYTIPLQPDLIPYVTSYYKERYGFCMSENQKESLTEDDYEIFIDSNLKDGYLTYGEIIIKGKSEKEIFLSTYICHPQMANNELSGPVVAINLAKWLSSQDNFYTYRIIFIPETIGSITYLSKNYKDMKKNIIAGFVLTCVGDNLEYSYLESPNADTLADKVAQNILRDNVESYKRYTFLTRGSDERQYCSVGIELPVCSVMRSKYATFPEYHTSGDDLNFISQEGLDGAFQIYKKMIIALEANKVYKTKISCEPQLGKRGLYPTISSKATMGSVRNMTNFLAYANGKNDLLDISNKIKVSIDELIEISKKLKEANLIEEIL